MGCRVNTGIGFVFVLTTFLLLWKWEQLSFNAALRYISQEKCAPGASQYVILLSYARSGSSLTNEIIAEHPDVFMYFEPLHNLAKMFGLQQAEYEAMTNRHLSLTRMADYDLLANRVIERLLTCDYSKLSRLVSLNHHAYEFTLTEQLYKCVNRSKTPEEETECLRLGQERCRQKPVRLIKTLRLSVDQAGNFINSHSCAKLIFLIKDPRGSHQSKAKLFEHYRQSAADIQRFCWRLDKDLSAAIKLREQYPDRVYITRFEDLAMKPLLASKRIYDFIGLAFTEKVSKFVYDKTHAKKDTSGYFNSRVDAYQACYRWRKSIPLKVVRAYNDFCQQPFSKLGYLPIHLTRQLRNFKVPLLTDGAVLS
ncbi:hypothetical protein RRG08_048233 [Elysia crispata]|uniref:Sulfotransferase n=1 Tax=Elysia crispata TaxID=231223 RepID=A0AAE0XZM5_9GAST|nr:hypothetical protein RRG08_048233 [Elysia crispata]